MITYAHALFIDQDFSIATFTFLKIKPPLPKIKTDHTFDDQDQDQRLSLGLFQQQFLTISVTLLDHPNFLFS